jgi:hypothetical protein
MTRASFEDVPLTLNNILFLIFDDKLFAYNFQGHKFSEASAEVNPGEATSSNTFDDFEIIEQ